MQFWLQFQRRWQLSGNWLGPGGNVNPQSPDYQAQYRHSYRACSNSKATGYGKGHRRAAPADSPARPPTLTPTIRFWRSAFSPPWNRVSME